jgi:exodeoxyribonuclease V gamma subunit
MFYLHVSNRTENLLRHLAEVVRVGERRSLFEKEVFLIQSQGMERMISQAMAAEFRSWCNFRYLLPLNFLTDIAGLLGMPVTPDSYDRGVLAWRIEALLHDLESEVYRPLQRYLMGENAGLKRFQLSCRLADIFDQYQIWRSEMLAGWETGKRATDHPSEAWQMALWRQLAAGAEGMPHRGVLLRQVIDRLNVHADLSRILPRRVSVFGLHSMPPLFLSYLQGLAGHCDVHLYLLSPCRHYWGDIENERRHITKRLKRIEQGLEPEEEAGDRHPLLASLGRQGRDFQEMLLKNVAFELEFNSFADPFEDQAPTLLHRLQSDLLRDRIEDAGEGEKAADGSIAVVSCHSRLRETGVLKDHILRLLHHDPSLELREIIVMAPDIQEYAALIPAVFDDIRHSIADRSLRRSNGALSAFIIFLKIFDGRFGWTEVLDLLKKEVVYPNFDLTIADLDTLQHWVTAAGIRWGLSAGQRHEMGFPDFAENTWSAGLDRLLMGYAIDTDQFVDGILPFTDIEGGQALALGGLCRFMEIFEKAGADFRRSRSLTDWSALLLHLANLLFGSEDDEDLLELRRILLALAETCGRFHGHPVDLQVIRAWLEQSAHETRAGSGFLRGGLTFCSMLPMRSIPFKVVCLLGMNNGEFPRNDRYATFDLMAPPRSRPGDRSTRTDDRYQFLEAILAARTHLFLSFVGRSVMTNETIPPSVVVTELLELLHNAYGIKGLVVEHPLHPFSHRYFSGEKEALFSYNREYCETAIRLQGQKDEAAPWWSGELTPALQQIPVRDLLSFFANPQRWFVGNRLGIRLDSEIELPDDREPFAPDGLDAYLIDQEIIGQCLDEKDSQILLQRLRAEGHWALGTPGNMAFAEKHRVMAPFAATIQALGMGERLPDRVIDCEVGGFHLTGVLSHLHENGILLARYADLKGKDLLTGWIHHLLLSLFPDCVQSTRILARDGLISFAGDNTEGPDLERLLEIFVQGCREPSPLLVEPAFRYVEQLHAPRSAVPPLMKAKESLQKSLDNGYEPEWALLFRGTEVDAILGGRFEDLCQEIINPIWSKPHAI